MGQRGPTAKPSSTVSTTVRLSAGMRARLDAAAKKRGKTLSNEVEMRLNRSFADDFSTADAFGDRQLQALARIAFAAARQTVSVNGGSTSWLNDPAAFDAAAAAIGRVLELVRPGEDVATVPGAPNYQPTFNAEELVREIATAPLVAPRRASRHALAITTLRKDLGDIVDRAGGVQARARSTWVKEYAPLRRKQIKAPASMTNEELARMRALHAEAERLFG